MELSEGAGPEATGASDPKSEQAAAAAAAAASGNCKCQDSICQCVDNIYHEQFC